jgi:5-methylcytosine-specific restriction protein B
MQRYKELYKAGRIDFVTFHQSFGYEDFVEGIRPVVNEQNQVSYPVKEGAFKRICLLARERLDAPNPATSVDFDESKLFKMSLGNTLDPADAGIYQRCVKNGVVVLGWGRDVDFSGCDTLEAVRARFREKYPDEEKDSEYNITAVHYLKNEVRLGDLILISDGNLKFRAIAQCVGDYRFDVAGDYRQTRPVRWLKVLDESLPIESVFRKQLSQASIYLMDQNAVKWDTLRELLAPASTSPQAQNFVLIIDEINRANVSKVLGELITLLEADKRLSAANELRARLPYSGEEFGVPRNLYVIGTMNTADRSIALLDTALRRRFEFVEMRPEPALVAQDIAGIDLRRMLEGLNQRIEFLFDRDHALGHALFMGITNLDELRRAFRTRIIPLLEEYFYEDLEKVAAVLNENAENGPGFLLMTELPVPKQLEEHVDDVSPRRRIQVNPGVFPESAFRRIYE